MKTRSAVPRLAAIGVALLGAVALVAPTSADAATGVFIWTGPGGDTPIPLPADDQCFATPGATAARNFTSADAFVFTDAACTTGMDAGSLSAFKDLAVGFESVRLRTPAG